MCGADAGCLAINYQSLLEQVALFAFYKTEQAAIDAEKNFTETANKVLPQTMRVGEEGNIVDEVCQYAFAGPSRSKGTRCTLFWPGGMPPPVGRAGDRNNYFTEMCSGSEAGSYLRLIDFVYHSTLGLRVIKRRRKE